ncbi:MAG: DJ-1 family glyoxalase III [Lachnospiraceae bacterium]
MKKVYVFLANGFEEIEGLTVVDLLRRAGICLTTVSIHDTKQVMGAHKIEVKADILLDEMEKDAADAIVLPGGMPGMTNLKENEIVKEMILSYEKQGKLIAAVCASPSIFSELGLLDGKNATSYPSFEENLVAHGAIYSKDTVVRDGNIITSRGLGTSIDFSLSIISYLLDEDKANEIAESIVYNR